MKNLRQELLNKMKELTTTLRNEFAAAITKLQTAFNQSHNEIISLLRNRQTSHSRGPARGRRSQPNNSSTSSSSNDE